MARTSRVCSPAVSPTISSTASQPENCSPSNAHSNSSTSASLLWKPKMTSGPESAGGADVMYVSGGAVSSDWMMSHSTMSGVESTTPEGLTARTWKSCGPTARPSTVCGDVHGVKSAPSREHSKSNRTMPFGSSPVNSKYAIVPVVSSSGPISMDVSGALTSTQVQVHVAGVASTLPISSMARILTVCLPY